MADINDHIDEFGFIVSTEPDVESRGGNSAQHSAIYYIAENIPFAKIWKLLDFQKEPRLHWKGWPRERGHMSRDNLTCCVCALKLQKMYPELRSLFWRIFMRAGFMWNNRTIGAKEKDKPWYTVDWCGPLIWFTALRFKWNPLNLIADQYLLASIQLQLYNTKKDLTHTDGHLNLIIIGETCRKVSGNFILNKILKDYADTGIPQYAADDYFDREFSPPLHVHLKKIVESWR